MILDIEEIRAAQVLVALLRVRVDAGHPDRPACTHASGLAC